MVFHEEISPKIAAQALLYYEESKLTVKEIAAKLKISRSSLYRLVGGVKTKRENRKKPGRKKLLANVE